MVQAGTVKPSSRQLHPDRDVLAAVAGERVYFQAIVPGQYVAAYPVFVIADDPKALMFAIQVDDVAFGLADAYAIRGVLEDQAEPRRAYVTATFRRRLHQVAFRERVVRAYRERCALCRLRHRELLDAAHITPDSEDGGDPVISNGLALCKLHHAAFDRSFFAVRPDYVIEVRPSILRESDGPMLVVGLQQIHGMRVELPTRAQDLPDPLRLARRPEEFRRVS